MRAMLDRANRKCLKKWNVNFKNKKTGTHMRTHSPNIIRKKIRHKEWDNVLMVSVVIMYDLVAKRSIVKGSIRRRTGINFKMHVITHTIV